MSTLASIKLTSFHKDVYEPSDDSFLLSDTILEQSRSWNPGWPRIALEIGCGTGYVITSLALILKNKHPHHLFATDINPTACTTTATTVRAHDQSCYIDILTTDLVSGLSPRIHGLVDLLIFNPPYVPTPDAEVVWSGGKTDSIEHQSKIPVPIINAAWAGGFKGRQVIDRFLPLVDPLLSGSGEMLMVAVPDNDIPDILHTMDVQGFEGAVVATRAADEELLNILHFKRKM